MGEWSRSRHVRSRELRRLSHAVKLERLQTFFSTSPAAKLLRSPHAAHVIYFLFRHFKDSRSITSPHSRLLQQLSEFLESVHQTDSEILKDRPETYLTA